MEPSGFFLRQTPACASTTGNSHAPACSLGRVDASRAAGGTSPRTPQAEGRGRWPHCQRGHRGEKAGRPQEQRAQPPRGAAARSPCARSHGLGEEAVGALPAHMLALFCEALLRKACRCHARRFGDLGSTVAAAASPSRRRSAGERAHSRLPAARRHCFPPCRGAMATTAPDPLFMVKNNYFLGSFQVSQPPQARLAAAVRQSSGLPQPGCCPCRKARLAAASAKSAQRGSRSVTLSWARGALPRWSKPEAARVQRCRAALHVRPPAPSLWLRRSPFARPRPPDSAATWIAAGHQRGVVVPRSGCRSEAGARRVCVPVLHCLWQARRGA